MLSKLFKYIVNKIRFVYRDFIRGNAFIYRNWCAMRRRFGWTVADFMYYVVSGLSVIYIGVAEQKHELIVNLFIGVLVWEYLSFIFNEISMNIAYEKWESTIEYTFMAPVSRVSHLINVCIFDVIVATLRAIVLCVICIYLFDLSFSLWQYLQIGFILTLSIFSFVGLGLIVATLPLINTENGAQGTYIIQGLLLLVSGIYYPVEILPTWVQYFSYASPATYAINACRNILLHPELSYWQEVVKLTGISIIVVPLGFYVFAVMEKYTKRHGKLKRNG